MKNWIKSDQPSIRKVNSLQADLKILTLFALY